MKQSCQLETPANLPPRKYPITHFAGGSVIPQSKSGIFWRGENPRLAPEFETSTVQPIVSPDIDYSIAAPLYSRVPT
jgi:hypothetical protein